MLFVSVWTYLIDWPAGRRAEEKKPTKSAQQITIQGSTSLQIQRARKVCVHRRQPIRYVNHTVPFLIHSSVSNTQISKSNWLSKARIFAGASFMRLPPNSRLDDLHSLSDKFNGCSSTEDVHNFSGWVVCRYFKKQRPFCHWLCVNCILDTMIVKPVPFYSISKPERPIERSSTVWRYKYFGILFLTIQQARYT